MDRKRTYGLLLSSVLLLSIFCSLVTAQPYPQHDFKFRQKLKEANEFFEMDDYKSAEALYLSIWPQDSLNEEINLNLGICKYKQKQFPGQIMRYLTKAEKSRLPAAQLYLAKVSHIACEFDKAIAYYNNYKSFPEKDRELNDAEVDRYLAMSIKAKSEMEQPHKAYIKNLGPTINSKYPDYVPLVSADESILFFTSRRPGSTGNQTDNVGNYYEDIYVSHKVNGSWTRPENVGAPVNTEQHDACVSLSPDAQQMLIFRTSRDLASGDLYSTYWNGKNWGEPALLGTEVNSPSRELSACVNNDNTMIIFTSDRPGGFGGKDLYRVVKLPNGKWSAPQNLGDKINTKYDEDAPFISPNGQFLYFSSNGYNTMGGYDIFRADFYEDNSFGEPKNLGYPTNTVGDDIFFVVTADGKHGYFSSLNEDKNDSAYLSDDIYLVDMRYDADEICVKKAVCKLDPADAQVPVQIQVYDESTKKSTGTYKPNARDGSFIFTVNPYDRYRIVAEAKGYAPISLDFAPLVEQEDYEADTDLLIIEFKKQ
ncbi:MAG: hypothetical protein ACJ77K_12935 [Bacteroidia bacterium]